MSDKKRENNKYRNLYEKDLVNACSDSEGYIDWDCGYVLIVGYEASKHVNVKYVAGTVSVILGKSRMKSY